MARVILFAAIASVLSAGPAPADAGTSKASFRAYLAAMSWPVRASELRAQSVSQAANDWNAYGDPPFLGQIAGRCRNFRAVEARGRLLGINPPAGLRAGHLELSRAYSKARAACREARLTALAVRAALDRRYVSGSREDRLAADRAETSARKTFRQLVEATLPAFTRAVRAWRSDADRFGLQLGAA